MEKEKLEELFKKYHAGTCSEKEKALLEAWYLQYNEDTPQISAKKVKAIGERVFRELPGNHSSFIGIGIRLAVAATVTGILLLTGAHFFMPSVPQKLAGISPIRPGTNRAVLTFANGQQIDLASTRAGQLDSQAGTYRTADNRLVYRPDGAIATLNTFNQLSTPKGGQWRITLPDGSEVWLNSASSLRYPTSFAGQKERIVQLSGEAYFEVSKDQAHPFKVQSKGQTIEVLGTHFNVNAYADEPAQKTTLAEGRVRVSDSLGHTGSLLPGQQALLSPAGLMVSAANVADELAWTKGSFHLSDQNITNIMRQISRWYDIEVRYEGDIRYDGLNGRISRTKNLDQVLNALEATGTVHFKVEGRRITVTK